MQVPEMGLEALSDLGVRPGKGTGDIDMPENAQAPCELQSFDAGCTEVGGHDGVLCVGDKDDGVI